MGKDIIMKMLKAIATKAKVDKWDLIKEFLHSKINYHRSKQASNEWDVCLVFLQSIYLIKA